LDGQRSSAHKVRLFLAISSVNSLALMSVAPLINPYLRNLGMSAAFVGLYFAVAAVVEGGAAFVGGFLADTLGRRPMWMAGKAFQIAGFIVLASGVRGSGILMGAVLGGLGQIGSGAVSALQADVSETRWRATFFAALQTVSSLAGIVAPLVGGLIADQYGARWAFVGILPMLAVILGLIRRVEDRLSPVRGHDGAETAARAAHSRPGALRLIRNRVANLVSGIASGPYRRTAVSFLVFLPLNGAANALILVGLPLLLRDRFGLGYVGISALNTAVCVGSVATMMLGARLADRFGRRRAMLVSILWCALVYWFAPVLRSPSQFYGLLFLDGLVGNAANGAFMATLMECVPDRVRATYSGVGSGSTALGAALGSLAAGLCYTISPMLPILVGATLFTACAVIAVLFVEETGPGAAAIELPTA